MSTVQRFHQFSPRIEPGRIASHTRIARAVLAGRRLRVGDLRRRARSSLRGVGVHDARHYGRSYKARPDDRLVYQMAIGSPVADQLLRRPEALVVNHHNLTPVRYLDGWDPTGMYGVHWGRRQLRALGKRAALGIAVSHFNETDLVDAGFVHTTVVPFFLDTDELTRAPGSGRAGSPRATPRAPGTNWLFVGRITANKANTTS